MAMHTVEIDHGLMLDMVRNNKFQFAASKAEVESMKIENGDVLIMDILNYDPYYDTHPVSVFIDGYGNKVVVLKNLIFEVASIVDIPRSSDVIVNMVITDTLDSKIPDVPEMKKSAGIPTDYL